MQRIVFGKDKWRSIMFLVHPRLKIGGLEISDTNLAYMYINPDSGKLQKASVRMEEGVVEKGVLKDPERFKKHLLNLRSQITHKEGYIIPVVLSISDKNVYTQRLSLPRMKDSEFQEAVSLNLQTISPIDFKNTYHDWEQMENEEETEEVSLFASFAEKNIIDAYAEAFKLGGFFVTAVESKTTSLVRAVGQFEDIFGLQKSYLIIGGTSDGISFIIISGGYVYFTRFSSWDEIGEDMESFIVGGYNQVSIFFENQVHKSFDAVYVAAGSFTNRIWDIVARNFSIKPLTVRLKDTSVDESWHVVLGAGLRGCIPLSQDTQISLASEGTELLYQRMRTSSFLSAWTGIFFSVSLILLASFIGVFIFLNSYMGKTTNAVASSFNDPQILPKYEFYASEAAKFNERATAALSMENARVRWGKFMEDLLALEGNSVLIDRLYVQSKDAPVSVTARAVDEVAANDFEKKIAKLPYVSDTNLPLSSFQKADGIMRVSFILSFNLANLNF